jgi:transcriptional regulator with XRE-family HTH domain
MSKKHRELRQRPETLATLLMPVFEEKLEESLGNRLRELRRQQALSLRALAEKSGLSANTLSLIENGKTSPSVATLQQIALALNVPITAFFDTETRRDPVIYTKSDQRTASAFAHGTLEEMGSGVGTEGLQPFIVHLQPQANSGPQPLVHDGSEFVYCLQGQVIYTIRDEQYTLEPGDSLLFTSKTPHSWHNELEKTSSLMIVMAFESEGDRISRSRYPA